MDNTINISTLPIKFQYLKKKELNVGNNNNEESKMDNDYFTSSLYKTRTCKKWLFYKPISKIISI